jgi:hypothetical protein
VRTASSVGGSGRKPVQQATQPLVPCMMEHSGRELESAPPALGCWPTVATSNATVSDWRSMVATSSTVELGGVLTEATSSPWVKPPLPAA